MAVTKGGSRLIIHYNRKIGKTRRKALRKFLSKKRRALLKTLKKGYKNLNIRKGPYGNYIRHNNKNIPLPKDIREDEEKLKAMTKDEVMKFVKNPPKSTGRKGGYKKGNYKTKKSTK